jgi:hypothetical protein
MRVAWVVIRTEYSRNVERPAMTLTADLVRPNGPLATLTQPSRKVSRNKAIRGVAVAGQRA